MRRILIFSIKNQQKFWDGSYVNVCIGDDTLYMLLYVWLLNFVESFVHVLSYTIDCFTFASYGLVIFCFVILWSCILGSFHDNCKNHCLKIYVLTWSYILMFCYCVWLSVDYCLFFCSPNSQVLSLCCLKLYIV